MAEIDLRISANYPDHPKVLKLLSLLGPSGVVSHITLLCYVRRVFPSGVLKAMGPTEIESAARWHGDPGILTKTLVSLKLLDVNAQGIATCNTESNATSNADVYSIHDWTDHNLFASTAPIRQEIARAAANKRWEKRRVNAKRIANSNAPSPTPSPSPYPLPSPIPNKLGEFSNVILSDSEIGKLKARFGESCQERIDRLSYYLEQIGPKVAAKKYRSHYATILNWDRMDKDKHKKPEGWI